MCLCVLMCCITTTDQTQQYAYQMVRTDSKEMKLDAFVRPSSLQQTNQPSHSQIDPHNENDPIEMDTTMAATGSEGYVIIPVCL